MKKLDENLKLRPRPSKPVTLTIPCDALESIERVAAVRDMSPEALLKFYIGQGLRQDTSKLFSERVLETTSRVLDKHLESKEERAAILKEIQREIAV